jgi:hypothetical protein
MRTSPTKLCVIDPVPQHNVKANGQLARYRHFGHCDALAKGQAAIRPTQSRIVPAGNLRGFDQKKTQQAITLFGQVAETLPSGAGIFFRDQPHLASHVPRVREAFDRTQHQHRAQCGE